MGGRLVFAEMESFANVDLDDLVLSFAGLGSGAGEATVGGRLAGRRNMSATSTLGRETGGEVVVDAFEC